MKKSHIHLKSPGTLYFKYTLNIRMLVVDIFPND
jgi:hypothetical protein